MRIEIEEINQALDKHSREISKININIQELFSSRDILTNSINKEISSSFLIREIASNTAMIEVNNILNSRYGIDEKINNIINLEVNKATSKIFSISNSVTLDLDNKVKNLNAEVENILNNSRRKIVDIISKDEITQQKINHIRDEVSRNLRSEMNNTVIFTAILVFLLTFLLIKMNK